MDEAARASGTPSRAAARADGRARHGARGALTFGGGEPERWLVTIDRAAGSRDRWSTRTTTRSSAFRRRPRRPRSRRPIASWRASSIRTRTRIPTPRSASRRRTRRRRSSPIPRSESSTTSSAPTGRPTSRPASDRAARPTGPASAAHRAARAGRIAPHRPRTSAGSATSSASSSAAVQRPASRPFGGGRRQRRLRVRRPLRPGRRRRRARPRAIPSAQATAEVTLAEVATGAERMVNVNGRRLHVKIPAGVSDGSKVKLQRRGRRRRPGHQRARQARPALRAPGRRAAHRAAADPGRGAARRRGPGAHPDRQREAPHPTEHPERPGDPPQGARPAEAWLLAEGRPDRDHAGRAAQARRGGPRAARADPRARSPSPIPGRS